uniref:Mucin-7-like n=1 Tax=Drosophila rhopaloa TaxID=1041015 RepID=A0A6P4EYV7_DRORH
MSVLVLPTTIDDVLLGMDFLSKTEASLEISQVRLKLRQDQPALQAQRRPAPPTSSNPTLANPALQAQRRPAPPTSSNPTLQAQRRPAPPTLSNPVQRYEEQQNPAVHTRTTPCTRTLPSDPATRPAEDSTIPTPTSATEALRTSPRDILPAPCPEAIRRNPFRRSAGAAAVATAATDEPLDRDTSIVDEADLQTAETELEAELDKFSGLTG